MGIIYRYHCNVVDMRVAQRIKKETEDGLFISSVACCSDLWALIFDAVTGFTFQVYKLYLFFFIRSLITRISYFFSLIIGFCKHS